MDGKEKLYFLLEAINDARVLAPSGQPLIIDPTNDLNRKYRDIELKQLFTKLEKDEQILKVLQVPSGISRVEIVEDLDPYDPPYQQDDGCWHIELLPAFDDYFWKIQQEPEYQEFTGKKPTDSPTKLANDTLITYEEKLDLILKALVEAKKATVKGQTTELFYKSANNGLDGFQREEIYGILNKLQEEEKILTVWRETNRLLPLNQQPKNPNFILVKCHDGFDDWYGQYLLKQKSKPNNLDWLNLLKILDVCSDIDQQLQMTRSTTVVIPSFPYPYIGRFLELFPYDSIGTRKSYQQHRWEGAQYLLREGIALEANYDNDDVVGYGNIDIRIDLIKFDDFYKALKAEFEKRQKSNEENKSKPKTDELKIDQSKVKLRVTYNAQKGELDVEGKKVKLNKNSFRAKLLELLLKDDKSRKKEWSWDEVIETIEDTKDEELTKENKNKFYPACDGLSKHIASKTGVNDLLIFNKSTVQLNPKYL